MNRLNVLLIVPTNVSDLQGTKGSVADAIEPPAKARFIGAYLMRRNASVGLIDANVTNHTPDEVAREVKAANPYLVVLPVYGYNPSASTQTMVSARKFADAIKNEAPEIPVMMTGTHPAAIPETTLRTEPSVDYVCGGEGPITVYELLQVLQSEFMIGISNVRSLWYREDGKIVHTEPAPLVNLNEEPALPGWSLMDPRKYQPHHWQQFYQNERTPYANPYSVEGCPFHCDFCNIQAPYREGEVQLVQLGKAKPGVNSYRFLAPELFVEEVTYLVENYGVQYFKIPDEMFMLHPAHVVKIAELINERFGDSLNFWCYARIDTCKPKFLDPCRAAGIRWIGLGIEAADSKVRSGQDKKFGKDTIYKVVEQVRAADIEGGLNYIFGLPDDTMASMEETYHLACELNGTYSNFYCTQALPGSELYRRAKANGYPLPERPGGPGWIGHAQYSYESEPFYEGAALTPAQILKFRDEAHVGYYRRPEYRAKLLADPKFGRTALNNIDAWISHLTPDRFKRRLIEEAEAGQSTLAP